MGQEEFAVGARLRIYWVLDRMWYWAEVIDYDKENKLTTIKYEADEEIEQLDMSQHRYQVEGQPIHRSRPSRAKVPSHSVKNLAGGEYSDGTGAPQGTASGSKRKAPELDADGEEEVSKGAGPSQGEGGTEASAREASAAGPSSRAGEGATQQGKPAENPTIGQKPPAPAPTAGKPGGSGGGTKPSGGTGGSKPGGTTGGGSTSEGKGKADELATDGEPDGRRWTITAWLEAKGLGKYAALFEMHEVDMSTLPLLTLEDLRDMPIRAVGPRRKILHAISKMQKSEEAK